MYRMVLIKGSRELEIPVLPEKLSVTSPGKNERMTVLELGEINLQRRKGVRTMSWSSFFPARYAPYVTGRAETPIDIVKSLQDARDNRTPLRFLITGTDLDFNIKVLVDRLEYEERAGEPGDLYYTIELSEWVDYSPKRIDLSEVAGRPSAVSSPTRSGTPNRQGPHTVKAGDCLWAIAQTYYQNGNRYMEIYNANKSVIDSKNRQYGNPQFTIYPGQVLQIP